jgi:outer membrane protein OmpA-like peptidoglycan-associated protein
MVIKSLLLLFFIFNIPVISAQTLTGLRGEYYNGSNFQEKVVTRTDAKLNFYWQPDEPCAPGVQTGEYSVRWTGRIKAPQTGEYIFRVHVDDGVRVWIGNTLLIDRWDLHDEGYFSARITLQAAQFYNLKVEYFNGLFEGQMHLYWQLPNERGLFNRDYRVVDPQYFFQPLPLRALEPPTMRRPATETAPSVTTPAPTTTQPPKPVAAPRKQPAVPKDTIEKYLPRNVLFEKSKNIILAGSLPELDRLAGFLLRNPLLRLRIEGHTDRIGDAAKNLVLSQERADKVAQYLIEKGIAASRIEARGYGDTRPLATGPANVPMEQNRRVEFVVY